jgi:TonB family protein
MLPAKAEQANPTQGVRSSLVVAPSAPPAQVDNSGETIVANFPCEVNDANAPGENFVPPRWLRKPSQQELNAGFPPAAVRKNVGGQARLDCEVNTKGILEACKATEIGSSYGFDKTALALAPKFLLAPATKNGVPIRLKISIPIKWETPNFGDAVIHDQIAEAYWLTTPTPKDLDAAFPAKASDIAFGKTVSECRIEEDGHLARCKINVSEPRARGFEEATKLLWPRFRASTEGKLSADRGAYVTITIQFENPATRTHGGPPPLARDVSWTRLPNSDFFISTYPKKAIDAHVSSGLAVVFCTADATGSMTDCSVQSEDPPGLGFGDAALPAAEIMQANLWTKTGTPIAGARVRIPIQFKLPKHEAAALQDTKAAQ